MVSHSVRGVRRRRVTGVAEAIVVGVIALVGSACSGTQESVQAANAPIGIQTDQMFITIENRAGLPLLDLKVAIQPAGAPAFTHLIWRLENGEKRPVSLSDFSSRDGTPFNLRLVTPKTVRVTATDVTSKPYDVQVPWR
jgi:hypothetical protein